MTENEFLIKLEQQLSILKKDERLDIIRDFKDYFSNGKKEGKSDEEIIESFGPMEELVEELLSAYSEEEFIKNVNVVTMSFNKVNVRSDKVNIKIEPSKDDQPYIYVKNSDGKTKVNMDILNNTLEVKVERVPFKKFFFEFIVVKKSIQITIQLPQILYEEIIVKNDDGKIEIESLQGKRMSFETDNGRIVMQDLLASSLNAETDNGRIVLEKSNFTTVLATTDNGRIIVNKTNAEKLELTTDNGAIELNDVSGEIVATTDNGRIEGYIPVVTKPLKWTTDNGSIVLKTDEPLADAILSTKSDLGGIDVYGEKGSKFLFGKGTVPIQLKTDLGRITVKTAKLEEV